MNLQPYNTACPDLLFANFNQDCKCFVVGTKNGFRIFNSDPLRQKDPQQHYDDPGAGAAAPEEGAFAPGPRAPGTSEAGDTAGSLGGGQMSVTYAEMLFRLRKKKGEKIGYGSTCFIRSSIFPTAGATLLLLSPPRAPGRSRCGTTSGRGSSSGWTWR